jgi:hypothetical protein
MQPIGFYSLITFFIFALISIANFFVTFFKACNMGLSPPSPVGLVSGYKFWQFISEISKQGQYIKLKKYYLFHHVILFVLAVCFLLVALHDKI